MISICQQGNGFRSSNFKLFDNLLEIIHRQNFTEISDIDWLEFNIKFKKVMNSFWFLKIIGRVKLSAQLLMSLVFVKFHLYSFKTCVKHDQKRLLMHRTKVLDNFFSHRLWHILYYCPSFLIKHDCHTHK